MFCSSRVCNLYFLEEFVADFYGRCDSEAGTKRLGERHSKAYSDIAGNTTDLNPMDAILLLYPAK